MSLGKDLASIRKRKNLTLEDIQNAIKIPLSTLKSIEDDSIFSDPSRNKTYIRSFVRSYAKVLKIDDKDIVTALDEMEAGTYAGSLFPDSPSSAPTSTIRSNFADQESLEADTDPESPKEEPEPAFASQPVKESKQQPEKETPDVSTINWADMGQRFTEASKSSRVWLLVFVILIVGAIGGSGYFFWDNISGIFNSSGTQTTEQSTQEESSDTNPIIPATPDTSETENTPLGNTPDAENQEPAQPITLGDTLTVTLYAAFGQLEPVRVTSDLNGRTNPFWMEQGEAYYFDFNDSLLVRGQYSRLLLLFNGHVIENPRQNHFDPSQNSIVITREILDREQYLNPPPEEFPLEVGPPDSTIYRIRF